MTRTAQRAPRPGGPELIRRRLGEAGAREWDARAREVLDGKGFQRVLGGPGTGKTTLLAETAAVRILDGADPDQVLVLSASRRAADGLRTEIARLLTGGPDTDAPRTVREPLVRTVHSYAFGVLRAQATSNGAPPPRLLSGPEQDAVVRDLLAGDMEAGAAYWPDALRPALVVPGFGEELRDLVLRAAERGLGPEDLVRLGKRKHREEWVAAGTFWKQYEQVTLLQGAGGSALAAPSAEALDAAELVSSALLSLIGDGDLLDRERRRIRHLLVDDAQHLDPLQWRLLRLIGQGAEQFVIAGDGDQAVFSFRGADPRILAHADESGDATVVLETGHRMTSVVAESAGRIAAAMPRSRKPPIAAPDVTESAVSVRRFPNSSFEASWVADQLRRAHLIDGIAWSEMAIVVRSAARTFPVLQRALRAAGVPISAAADELPLARNPAVRPLLTALRVASNPDTLDGEVAEQLLSSSLGGADPLALRRLRRGLRRLELAGGGLRPSDDLLVEALRTGDPLIGLADSESAPMRRVGDVLAAGKQAISRSAGVEQVLWEMWRASGLQRRWQRLSERGGSLGRQADTDLDAVVALFHAAGSYVDRLPHAGVAGFADYLLSQRIAGDSLAPSAAKTEGVELLTAHGAVGREWALVAVPSVQEGSWPDLRPRGSLLGVERLVDLMAGIDAQVSAIAPLLAEERRLFYVAASRARVRLLVSATEGEDEQPSRFLDDIEVLDAGSDARPIVRAAGAERPLVLSRLVGDLRSAVCDPGSDDDRRGRAARQLARLAQAGVPGAHPDSWYGLGAVSTEEPLKRQDELISVSPSTVDMLGRCPLRWLVERNGGTEPPPLAAVTGTVIHALAQAAADGATDEQLRATLDAAWSQVNAGAPWFSRRERQRLESMVTAFLTWLRGSRHELTEAGVERDIEVELPVADGEPRIRLRGRIDRLERDSQGRLVVVDLKTSKSAVSKADAQQHPQLATYQLAITLGAAGDGGEPGGGRLIYVADVRKQTGAAKELPQDPLDEPARVQWLGTVRRAAVASVGPEYVAQEGPDCGRCPSRGCCPLQPEGRQVTS
ncbi:MAG: AAA family ATPase [Actinophytocola sp.]|nr:AAA family ATPase [Actinophytocola sp.]